MKTISTTVYEYDELNDAAKAKARKWFLEFYEQSNEWSESVIEGATIAAKFLGITTDDIRWSGFYSQGDGACFVGRWAASSVKPNAKLLSEYPEDKELHRLAKAFEEIAKEYPEGSYTTRHTGHYYHSHSVSFDVNLPCEVGALTNDEAWLLEISRDFMCWIYSDLKKAYEYEISDEVVAENIMANEYTFTESGKRYG